MAYAYSLALPAAFESESDSLFPTFRRFFISVHDHFIPHERNNYHPHILGHRFLGLFSLFMIALKFSMIAAVAISPATTTQASAITISNVISLSNASRASNGLPALKENSLLDRAAQNKANDMLAKGYFAHNSPDGKTPWYWIKAVGYSYISAGENLAVDFTEAENIETAWMNSPGHRANILNKNYQEIGIGIAKGAWQGHQTTFVVQMFGTPVAQKVALTDTPTAVAPAPVTQAVTQPAPAPISTPAPAPTATPTPQAVTQQPAPAPVATTSTVKTPTPSASQPAPVTQPAPAPSIPVSEPVAPPQDITASTALLEPAKITDVQTSISGEDLVLNVTTTNSADQVIASFNERGIMLYPRGPQAWQGSIPLASLAGNVSLAVRATDIAGHNDLQPVANFSNSKEAGFGSDGAVKGASINVFGMNIDRHAFEQKFFLLVITGILASLILAIAIKRHIQHLSLVANGSFVAILAVLLWISG